MCRIDFGSVDLEFQAGMEMRTLSKGATKK
jgi:hypothetical protein